MLDWILTAVLLVCPHCELQLRSMYVRWTDPTRYEVLHIVDFLPGDFWAAYCQPEAPYCIWVTIPFKTQQGDWAKVY